MTFFILEPFFKWIVKFEQRDPHDRDLTHRLNIIRILASRYIYKKRMDIVGEIMIPLASKLGLGYLYHE
ncbi:hypothetical protein BZY71_14330 [Leclercia adecarboxylata]|nr:hypothetical protein BZY71_14330 [Leclercia adecarboxylata]RFS80800.1 hypothetical protein D0U00_05270 [Leclercia adecarboxylata]